MLDNTFVNHFAADWIDSWNKHDLERVLSHYSDDFEMTSPVIIKVAGEPSGTLKGKQAVGAYWAKALQLFPGLHFELVAALAGVNSITLYYNGVSGPAAEVFHFNQDGKVAKAYAHYLVRDPIKSA
ncbi:MAG: nuclear transport factor 2 family protein [Methylotenera sp.]